ncbi:hypothetical protein BDP27DRAFT_1209367 [Rhodocollybia butyracea]|uniref:Uncharacterized protein n=1 Tax=Rhodocollybia butyracea TaxID=206335 RepID=A0A9P5UE37_9AGAR|nr:hypothetical protein BDP27DRAFT_1209367 [Rhodocollybia butyracea]
MEHIVNFNAILFPSDGRPPTIVQLMTSPMSFPGQHSSYTLQSSRMPHPEIHMDYIAENLGPRAWKYQATLDGMNRKFAAPYIIFYPVVSRDGMSFPVNRTIREIQGRRLHEGDESEWRGNVVIAKYRDNPFSSLIDASMADFPILKNYLSTHGCPQVHVFLLQNLLYLLTVS